jgi:ATP-binding cassette subfamily G (WHITE) protein 2 (PDR)
MQRSRSEPSPRELRRHDSLAYMDEIDQRELQRLATSLSRIRTKNENGDPGAWEEGHAITSAVSSDPALDPSSPSFDLHKYLERIIGLLRKEGITPAQAGVSFKDLNVSGTGDALQLQHTIGDWIQAPMRLGEHLSFAKKPHKKILHSFDGLVNSGELLIVLGRPGSGCSTLLKTMTGELHGLDVDKQSVIHYNGIPQDQMMKEFKGEAIYNQEVSCHCWNYIV